MSAKATVRFATPQSEIASLIAKRILLSTATSIVTGFARLKQLPIHRSGMGSI